MSLQDQMRALREMCFAAFGDKCPHVDVYDGDTAKVIAHSGCNQLLSANHLNVCTCTQNDWVKFCRRKFRMQVLLCDGHAPRSSSDNSAVLLVRSQSNDDIHLV